MKKILSLIILFFFINNCSESYNKSDLQMNGVILGQSLLDHLDEKQIKDLQIDWASPIKNDKVKTIVLERNNSDIFKNLETLFHKNTFVVFIYDFCKLSVLFKLEFSSLI